MNRKPLRSGVVVSLMVLALFEVLLAVTHPPLEPAGVDEAAADRFIRAWEGYWFNYGVGTKATAWRMREDFKRTYRYQRGFGPESEWNRQLSPDEFATRFREAAAGLSPRLQAVQTWAVLAWPVGWLAFGVAWLVWRLALGNARVGDELQREGRGRAARNSASLTLALLAVAGAVLVLAVLFPVGMVRGDVPSGLMSAPMIAGWITVWRLGRRQQPLAEQPEAPRHAA